MGRSRRSASPTWRLGQSFLHALSLAPLLTLSSILAAWYLVGQDKDFPPPGIGIQNLTEPHEQIDARIPESQTVILEGAIAGHVLLKNELNTLPLGKPTMLSVYGYDAVAPRAKNTDLLFQLGYESSAEMGNHEPGDKYRFDQAAMGGTLFTGGRAGANAPAYIIDVTTSLNPPVLPRDHSLTLRENSP